MNYNTNKIYPAILILVALGMYFFRSEIKDLIYPVADIQEEKVVFDTGQSVTEESDKDVQTEEIIPAQTEKQQPEKTPLPQMAIIADVPFTSQAPFGDWADPKQQHGCEEASLLMARYWIQDKKLTKETALTEIFAMSEYEEKNYGVVYDLSIADTLKFWREYYGYKKSFTKYDVSAEDIKQEIAAGNPVIVPMDGTILKNPQYTAPGPQRHELVVIGYDNDSKEFITNDPGTRFGEGYRYSYENFMDSIRDYKTGFDAPIDGVVRAMLVIEKE